jgi:hypothetical protein
LELEVGASFSARKKHFLYTYSFSMGKQRLYDNTVSVKNEMNIPLLLLPFSAGILVQTMGARNRQGIGFSFRPRLVESIPWNRIRGSLKV